MSMSPEEIAAFVDRLYGATAAGDWDGAAALLSDDFVAYESNAMPMAGAYRGKGALKELFEKVMGMVDVVGMDRTDLLIGADSAIAVIEMRFADPSLPAAELCEMFRLRDGLCCEIKPYYYDPAVFAAACESKKAST